MSAKKSKAKGVEPRLVTRTIELRDKEVIHLGQGTVIGLAVLSGGMQSGKPSIMLRIDLPDGRTVMAETSWRLLRSACDAISARYGSGGD